MANRGFRPNSGAELAELARPDNRHHALRRGGVGPAGPCHAARAKLADFYERAILNGIVGNQNRHASAQAAAPEAAPPAAAAVGSTSSPPAASPTSYIYMQPLGGANTKPWGKSDYGFPCCWGTLSESFAKLSDSIFFVGKADREVFVNQFAPATARLAACDRVVAVGGQ